MKVSHIQAFVVILIGVVVLICVVWLSILGSERLCRGVSYDFVDSYGDQGIEWDFFGISDYIKVKVRNNGDTVIYGFWFEIEVNGDSKRFQAMDYSQRTRKNPLKPGENVVLDIDLSEVSIEDNADLTKVTVFDGLGCKSITRHII